MAHPYQQCLVPDLSGFCSQEKSQASQCSLSYLFYTIIKCGTQNNPMAMQQTDTL